MATQNFMISTLFLVRFPNKRHQPVFDFFTFTVVTGKKILTDFKKIIVKTILPKTFLP